MRGKDRYRAGLTKKSTDLTRKKEGGEEGEKVRVDTE